MVVFFNWPSDRPNDIYNPDIDDPNVIPNRLDPDPNNNTFPRPSVVVVTDDKYIVYA